MTADGRREVKRKKGRIQIVAHIRCARARTLASPTASRAGCFGGRYPGWSLIPADGDSLDPGLISCTAYGVLIMRLPPSFYFGAPRRGWQRHDIAKPSSLIYKFKIHVGEGFKAAAVVGEMREVQHGGLSANEKIR